MKKTTTKKLILNRQTLRVLNSDSLTDVRGGLDVGGAIVQIGGAIVSAVQGSCGAICQISKGVESGIYGC